MKQSKRRQYSISTARRMRLFEREYLRSVYDVLQAEYVRAARALKDGKIQEYLNKLTVIDGLGAVLGEAMRKVALFYARKTTREINASARQEKKAFGLDQVFIDLIIQYLSVNLLNKAVLPITNTTKKEIMSILAKGEQEGWGIDKMVFELTHSDLPVWRARMIIRTELLQAQHIGRKIAQEESEYETEKQWISAHDHRTRHSHREVDGETVTERARFSVRRRKGGVDMMDGPGDPTASAENVINCRCTLSVVAARDENGRLIRKRKISLILPGEVQRARPLSVTTV